MAAPSVIELSHVTFGFPGRPALFEDLALRIDAGRYYVVEGPSGSGKSTLLRLMNRLEEPEAGTIRFQGKPLDDHSPARLRQAVSLIQQTPTVVDASVRDNLLLPFGFRVNRGVAPPDDSTLQATMGRFLMEGVALDQNAMELSMGQRQRLCFVRALLLEPHVLLLDEPTASLDDESAGIVEEAAWDLNREKGLTVVNVSHRGTVPQAAEHVRLHVAEGTVTVA